MGNNTIKCNTRRLTFVFHCIACLVGAWLYGSIWIMPPLFGWNRFILEGFGTSCTFDYVSKDRWDQTFILVLTIGGFFVPLLVIVISYSIILMKLSQRGRQLINQSTDTSYSHSQSTQLGTSFFNHLHIPHDTPARIASTPTHDSGEDSNMSRNMRRTEARATRTALMVCAVFCAAWGPYTFMALLSLFGWDHLVNAYTTAMLGIFAKAAAGINPLIYALSLRGFREKICSYVQCLFHCDEKHQRLLSANPDLHRTPHPNSIDINTRHRTHSASVFRSHV
jgi:r-opsin